jgi:peptide/nickel transport system substrate-binding protein
MRESHGGSGVARRLVALLAVLVLAAAACASDSGGSGETEGDGPGSDTTDGDGSPATTVVGASTADEGEPQAGGSLVLALNAESTGFNPLIDLFAIQTHYVASAIFDPLTRVDENGDAVPHLAESVSHNDDATVWTITLRDGVEFHDGSPLTAEVVQRNLEVRRDDPRGRVQFPLLEEVTATGPLTVEVAMSAPWVAFDHLLTQQSGYIVSASMLDAYPQPADLVGTGPFVFEDWVPDNRVDLRAFDDYWQQGKPYLDQLQFRVLTDPGTGYQSFTTGDIDALFVVDASIVGRLLDDDRFKLLVDRGNEENVIVLNAGREPFDRIEARRAAVQAVDAETLNEVLYDSIVEVAEGPFSEGQFWYDPDTNYAGYDPEAARRAVAEYEEATGQSLRFELGAISSSDSMANAELLKEMWEAVGIQVDIEPVEQGLFIGLLVSGQLQAARLSNFGYADPDFLYLFFHSSNASLPGEGIGTNFSYTVNGDLDAALELGRRSPDPEVRQQAYGDMVRALNEEFAYIWLNHRVTAMAAQPDVNGLAVVEALGFGRVDSKPWLADIWIAQN